MPGTQAAPPGEYLPQGHSLSQPKEWTDDPDVEVTFKAMDAYLQDSRPIWRPDQGPFGYPNGFEYCQIIKGVSVQSGVDGLAPPTQRIHV